MNINENFSSVGNYQKMSKHECEEEIVAEVSGNSNFKHCKKPSKIPVFHHKLETPKLSEQLNMNRTGGIKGRNKRINVPGLVVTKVSTILV